MPGKWSARPASDGYRHFMLKGNFRAAGGGRRNPGRACPSGRLLEDGFGPEAPTLFEQVQGVHIIACGTSYPPVCGSLLAGKSGRALRGRSGQRVPLPSRVTPPGTLFVSISQSGETADTLAALRAARERGYLSTLAICNVAESSLVRESALTLLTRSGREVGVASTKAFTTQLVALRLLTLMLGRRRGLSEQAEAALVRDLELLPRALEEALLLDGAIERLAEHFAEKHHALFLGRGPQYPIAMEGALKLKEISYIHAEAYPAGELLGMDRWRWWMPTCQWFACCPRTTYWRKCCPTCKRYGARRRVVPVRRSRGGYPSQRRQHACAVAGRGAGVHRPIVFAVPLQLLAYHAAVLKGTDVDQPRNLAKSVTVE